MHNLTTTQSAMAELVKVCGPLRLWSMATATLIIWMMAAAGVYVATIRFAGAKSSDVRVGSFAASMVFDSNSSNVHGTLIHPNGWQDSHILVKQGQRIDCVVGGSVNIDLSGTVERALLRREYEDDVTKRRAHATTNDTEPLPEDDLTIRELEQLSDRLRFQPWAGPNGHNPATPLSHARASRRAMSGAPLGALIAQIRFGNSPEQTTPTFLVGERLTDFEIPHSGSIWFNVNDVVFPAMPELYYADNVGFFVAVVTVH